jgi:integrase
MQLYNFVKRRETILSPSEISILLDATQNRYYRLALMIGLNSGISSSELLAIRSTDIDLHRGILHIVGGAGSRDIELKGKILTFIIEGRYISDDSSAGLLFPFSVTMLNKYMDYCSKKLKKPLSWRDIRHTYVAISAAAGVKPEVVAKNIGTSIDTIVGYF